MDPQAKWPPIASIALIVGVSAALWWALGVSAALLWALGAFLAWVFLR